MRFAFFMLMCLFSLGVQARGGDARKKSPETMADIRRALDMKIFHDRVYVKEMIQKIYEQDKAGITSNPDLMKEIGHEGIFNKKDSDIIRQEAARKVVRTKLMNTPWDEQVKTINEDPFNAFIGLIEDQEVPNLKQEELNNLNSVDKRVIPEMLQMMTESGPDIGASAVPVVYDENINLR